MSSLFREIFKRVNFKYAILIILAILLFQIIFVFFTSATKVVQAEFSIDKSPNPEASSHFIKAMTYKHYIGALHDFVNYDNFLMKPFLNKMNEEYEKGKSLLPKTSAEDVYWFVILYRGLYGIGGYPEDKDMSISYETTLKIQDDYQKHYENIVDKIKRYANNDFDYDIPRITQYKFEFMANLIDEFILIIDGYAEKDKKTYLNKKYLEDFITIYEDYKKFSKKYLPLANKQNENKVSDIYI